MIEFLTLGSLFALKMNEDTSEEENLWCASTWLATFLFKFSLKALFTPASFDCQALVKLEGP